MNNALRMIALISVASFASPYAQAACGVQSVTLSSGKTQLAQWDVMPGEMREITLPNGFELGLEIEPAPEKTRQLAEAWPEHPRVELVKISLFDLTSNRVKRLTYTFGGVNSLQGYGPKGGADGVKEVGEPGILLELKKPACSASYS